MSKLAEHGLVDLKWSEDEDGNIFAEGLQEYEIDTNLEVAIFQGEKCVRVIQAEDMCHAAGIVAAQESVCRWHLKMGATWRGHKINERGWDIGK